MERPKEISTAKPPATVAEFAALTRLNLKTCYDAIKRGEVPVVQIGRRKLIPRAWLESRFGRPE